MYLSVDVRNKTSKYSHLQDADLQCLEKPNETKGTTTTESMLFNCLDIVTHNEWDENSALIESMTLDDFDAGIYNHMSDICQSRRRYLDRCKVSLLCKMDDGLDT